MNKNVFYKTLTDYVLNQFHQTVADAGLVTDVQFEHPGQVLVDLDKDFSILIPGTLTVLSNPNVQSTESTIQFTVVLPLNISSLVPFELAVTQLPSNVLNNLSRAQVEFVDDNF